MRISFEVIQKLQYLSYFLRINLILIHNTSNKFNSSKNHTTLLLYVSILIY